MSVVAKSDAQFLIINAGDSFVNTGTAFAADGNGEATLLPVAPAVDLTAANITQEASWHYAYSNSISSSARNGDYKPVATGELGKYVASSTFSIGLGKDSGVVDPTDDIILKNVAIDTAVGVTAVVVSGDKIISTGGSLGTASTSGTVVTVYYYINGEDTEVFTNNLEKLTGAITLTFGLGTAA